MSMALNDDLIPFYMAGRGVKSLSKLRKYVDDPDEIAERIEKGTPVRAAIGAACDAAAAQLGADRKRKNAWLTENASELAALTAIGGKEEAWKAYCQGMSDELAYAIELDVLDVLESDDDDEGDDGDGDDDEGDDGDGDDDDKADAPS